MLYEIVGLPGGNKSTLVKALAAELDLPALFPDAILASCQEETDPLAIAVAYIEHAAKSAVLHHGVRKGSLAGATAHFNLRFDLNSSSPGAHAYWAVIAAVQCSPAVQILVEISVEDALAEGGGGLGEAALKELEASLPTSPITVQGPITAENVAQKMQHIMTLLQPQEGRVAKLM
jgi:hypothetical protein